ncbi:hypothetical protein C8R43DRAFT_1172700 [Mycena crocata]|nr:hypothetical protein C8R43DRAFT_1172700 [Mycena crocata]
MVSFRVLLPVSLYLLFGTISVLGQQTPIDPECQSACPADLQTKASSSDPATRCTNEVVSGGAKCVSCEVSLGKIPQSVAQDQLNDVVSDCAKNNHPVNPATITANGPSSMGGSSGGSNGGAGNSDGGSSNSTGGSTGGKPNSGEHIITSTTTVGLLAGLTALLYVALSL